MNTNQHRRDAIAWAAAGFLWIIIITRSIPGLYGDRGIFVSVAERLLAGDTLYVTVWDNKDPLFFLLLAAGRSVSPFMDVAIELMWLIAAGIAGFFIARRAGASNAASVLLGGSGAPLILAGNEYIPGFTNLPGSALTLVVVALAIRGRWAATGFLLVVLSLFKLIMLPVALAALLPFVWQGHKRRPLTMLGIGILTAVLLAGLLLAIRGELGGYIGQLFANVAYAGGSTYMDPSVNPILKRFEFTVTDGATVTILATTAAIALSYLKGQNSNFDEFGKLLRLAALLSLIAALLVIAFTGLREHHAQILYAPAVLALLLLPAVTSQLRVTSLLSVVVSVSLIGIFAGGIAPQTVVMGIQGSLTQLRQLDQISTTASDLLETGPPSTYARIGDNTDDAHAVGLRNWTLACPRFAQYGTDSTEVKNEMLDCLPQAEYVLIDETFRPIKVGPYGYGVIGSFDNWNALVEEVGAFVDETFTCTDEQWGKLCSRNSP
mgnify:CR=1 FL=1